jgi:uncharacterized RmlC-like cupin family protein
LEYFAPPPSQGTSGAYAQTKANLLTIKTAQDQWLGRWPRLQAEEEQSERLRVVKSSEALLRLEGDQHKVLVEMFISTEYLTVGRITLQPGQQTEPASRGGDEGLYLLEGRLHVLLPEHQGSCCFELNPGDGFYVPEGVPRQFFNYSDQAARLLFGVAPAYLPRL